MKSVRYLYKMALLCKMLQCELQEAMHCGDTEGPHYIHNRIFQDNWLRRGEDLVKLRNVERWRVHIYPQNINIPPQCSI